MREGQIAASGTVAEIVAGHPSTLSFRLPFGLSVTDLPPLAELGATLCSDEGGTIRLTTRNLQRTTTETLLWARDKNIHLAELNARSASLEEAFLHIARDGGNGQDPAEEATAR